MTSPLSTACTDIYKYCTCLNFFGKYKPLCHESFRDFDGHMLAYFEVKLESISKQVFRKESVTPAKAGVHLKSLEEWIPAFAGMTTEYRPIRKRNFEISSNNSLSSSLRRKRRCGAKTIIRTITDRMSYKGVSLHCSGNCRQI